MDIKKFKWIREPEKYTVSEGRVSIFTQPHTDLWQRTYYHFRNDNAPVFQMETEENFFSFTVKTNFEDSKVRFDQCGIVMYLDSENWLKACIEYENEEFAHLGSVVTNGGYSDWATTEISVGVKSMWYRFSRREDDYLIECSEDGLKFRQMRVCHMNKGGGKIRFGIFACSPEDSSFEAVFTNFDLGECAWKAHNGQQPDENSVKMKKVIVIGCPGSGKSTLSVELAKITELPLYHLDMMKWNADRTTVEKDVFLKRLEQVLDKDAWIIDGNYGSTMEMRMSVCDTVIFLDYPTDVCIEGVRTRRGKPRQDIPWIESENEEDSEFMEFIVNYNNISKPKVLNLLEKYSTKNIIVLKNRDEVEMFLKNLA